MNDRTPLVCHTGVAAPLLEDNIDTDQIIPSREMISVSKTGLGAGLFAGQRYISTASRNLNPDFILNQTAYQQSSILVSGANFGCGSSREHAVWALYDFGFRVIIAQSFGEIFQGNCARNGILAICLKPSQLKQIEDYVRLPSMDCRLVVDLENQIVGDIKRNVFNFKFDVDPFQRKLLLGGLDPIGLTLKKQGKVESFLESDHLRRPWVYDAS